MNFAIESGYKWWEKKKNKTTIDYVTLDGVLLVQRAMEMPDGKVLHESNSRCENCRSNTFLQ
jgi:hypothetical protein